MKKYPLFITLVTVSLVLDQLSKVYIENTFSYGRMRVLIENHVYITHLRNPGAAFGILADSAWRLPFFLTISSVAVIGILWYLRTLPDNARFMHAALALIFGGAVGNLIDRVRLGEVVDFIGVHWYQYHWPAFNIADSAICVGVAMLLFSTWRDERRHKKTA